MTRQQVLKYLKTNPTATIRQKNWFPEESLKLSLETGLFVDELGFEYNNLELFGSSEWEVMLESGNQMVM